MRSNNSKLSFKNFTRMVDCVERAFPHFIERSIRPYESREEIYRWCEENVGPNGIRLVDNRMMFEQGAGRWTHLAGTFWFSTVTEATAFKIRWG